jgi:hypothetical protein
MSLTLIPRGNVTFAAATTAVVDLTTTWTVPDNVYSISFVAVGAGSAGGSGTRFDYVVAGNGGGLAYRNNVPVTPGDIITIVAGRPGASQDSYSRVGDYLRSAGNSSVTVNGVTTIATSGSFAGRGGRPAGVYDGGGNGGNTGSSYHTTYSSDGGIAGGGGAGGYSGNGGNGAWGDSIGATAGTGGAGGGGSGGGGAATPGGTPQYMNPGGGVGLYGQGTSGGVNQAGSGGSGQRYGGGGYGGKADYVSSWYIKTEGGPGAVRIVWGENRAFPSTNVADATAGFDQHYTYSASGGLTLSGGIQLKMTNPKTIPHGEYVLNGPWTQYVSTSLSDYVGTWTVPANVYSISYVVVGPGGNGSRTLSYGIGYAGSGGALAYRNNVPVTPGQTVSIYMSAPGGSTGYNANTTITVNGQQTIAYGGGTGSYTTTPYSGFVDGGGEGGPAGTGYFVSANGGLAGGGGAGGYSGPGGTGGGHNGSSFVNATAGTGGGGGGGQFNGNFPIAAGWGGGGVGLYGQGADGFAGTSGSNVGGGGGSGGADGDGGSASYGFGGSYGGGAPGVKNTDGSILARRGALGGLRIIWGYNRKFPATNVSDSTTGTDTYMA